MAGRHRLRKRRHRALWVLVAIPAVAVGVMAYPALSPPQEALSPSVAASVEAWQARTPTPTPAPSAEPTPAAATGPCPDFGGTQPHIATAGRILEQRYPSLRITTTDDGLDLWTTDITLGWRVARYVLANLDELDALYVTYRSSVALSDESWHALRDRGNPTANHDDHVHVSFKSAPPRGADCPEEE
jgi:hypothetical protein